MMSGSKIRVLSDHTINKIAAGEVIENPSSVVKELVENSLDAGATEISIEIESGGRELIRITDNGSGMNKDDALLCLERHATSKIREVEDIESIVSMGFRGEAIPSIASISKFSLLTSRKNDQSKEEGTLVIVHGGKIITCAQAQRSQGTTIEIRSLFFNVPVRRKFQKSPTFDIQEILKIIHLMAMGQPSVQFELISDQVSIFKTPSLSGSSKFQHLLKERIGLILGKENLKSMIPLSFKHEPFEIEGFIGTPTFNKSNKTGQYLFINQRPVSSPLIGVAVRDGFGTMLPSQRYPIFVLQLRVPGHLIDVNVHPQKKEVRLRDESSFKQALIKAIQQALGQSYHSNKDFEQTINESVEAPTPALPIKDLASAYRSLLNENTKTFEMKEAVKDPTEWHYEPNKTSIPPKISTPVFETAPLPLLVPISRPSIQTKAVHTIPGYVIIDSLVSVSQPNSPEGSLHLLDQRAAYSRIYYEKMLKKDKDNKSIQHLLVPLTLSLSPTDCTLLNEYLVLLNELGLSIREFGENTFLVDSLPLFINENEIHLIMTSILKELHEGTETRSMQNRKEEKLAYASSKAAISKSKRLTLIEAQMLIDQLFLCELPFQCPLGRPTFAHIQGEQLSQFFKSTSSKAL